MSDWHRRALKKYPHAAWLDLDTDGAFAVLLHCRDLVIHFYATRDEAEAALAWINAQGPQCGGNCVMDHEVVDLTPRRGHRVKAEAR